MTFTRRLRWRRSTRGWQLRISHRAKLAHLNWLLFAWDVRVVAKRRHVEPPKRKLTVAQCRAESEAESLRNPIHTELAAHYVVGGRVAWRDDAADPRTFIDVVWVPDDVEVPASIRSWIGKGGCSSSPGDPGTWWQNVGYPDEPKAEPDSPQLALFAGAV